MSATGPAEPDSVVVIPLKHGLSTIVDRSDAALAAAHHWHVSFTGTRDRPYATTQTFDGGRRATVRLHRLIMGAGKGQLVDHVNGDSLDNRRCNLRICTQAQNQHNRGPNRNNTSGHKGVYCITLKKPWVAKLKIGKKHIYLGRFATKEEAVAAYEIGAARHHGEFAHSSTLPAADVRPVRPGRACLPARSA